MNRLNEFLRRLMYLGRRQGLDGVLDEEVQFHIESRAGELQQAGVPRGQALIEARREFGPQSRMLEDSRGAWQIRWLEDLLGDLRYAFRALGRSPGFALAAIFSLALGIGANTTVFSLTAEFLFSRPSARQPERLVYVRLGGNSHAPLPVYRFIRDAHIFDGVAGSYEEAEVNWRNDSDTYRLSIYRVTGNFFDVVGAPVAIGRPMQSGERNVAVLDYGFWQSQLSGDPAILGRKLILDGEPYTVVGVLPHDHHTILGFAFAPAMYLPVNDPNAIVALTARLPDGMPREAAYARLKATAKELDRVLPERDYRRADSVDMDPISGFEHLKSLNMIPFTAFFGMLMLMVGLVLIIACTNVASLLLARASARRQELGIRLAIGAGRGRLIRQLLTESLLLASLGTLAGLGLNLWLTSFMNRIQLPLPIRFQLHMEPDWRLMLYAAAIAIASTLFCGLLPALKATRADLHSDLKLKDAAGGGRRWNMRGALVIGQLTVSILLLSAGFLFLRNLMEATALNPGFDVDRTLWAAMRLVPEKYSDQLKTQALAHTALEALRALPGVEAASIASTVPLNSQRTNFGQIRTDLGKEFRVQYKSNDVGPDYFRSMAIPLIAGREFSTSDRAGAPAVVIINENLARYLFGETSPVGHSIWFQAGDPATIVGVAKNSKYFTLGEVNALAVYSSYAQQQAPGNLDFLIRAESPRAIVKQVTRILAGLDPTAAIETKPMRNALVLALLPSRAGASILGSVGLLGLLLAAIGLYGVLAYTISRRTGEIGLRVALGAEPRSVLWMVFRDSLALVAVGAALGLTIAVIATKPLVMFLVPGLSPADPLALLAAIGLLTAVALAATIGPALRALHVDPMVALRYE